MDLTKKEEDYIAGVRREIVWNSEMLQEKNIGVSYLIELRNVDKSLMTNFSDLSTILRRLNIENSEESLEGRRF